MKAKFLLALAAAFPLSASAVDMTWSGFGTLGFAQSNQPYPYLRFIDDGGTFKSDSLLGAQLDLKFDQHWGAAIQAKLAPSDSSDTEWKAFLSWAFVSWRPVDDILVRVGKLRVPLMLNTENSDVGATYDFARLPVEVYSMAPTTDFVGFSVSKSWLGADMEWTLDGYYGKAKNQTRFYGREIQDTVPSPGSWFDEIDVKSGGLVLTARGLDNVFRVGVHRAKVSKLGGMARDIPYVADALGPGVGFYDVRRAELWDDVDIPVQTAGASVLLPGSVRLTGEYARTKFAAASAGLNRWGAYLAVSRQFGIWNPYAYYAKSKSTDSSLSLYHTINQNLTPSPFVNDFQKLNADIVLAYDQWTGAIGTSIRVTPRSLIKAEFSQTNTGQVSSFVDAPSGGDSANKRINIVSLSYSFSF